MDIEEILKQNNLEQMELFEQGRGKALDKMLEKEETVRSEIRLPGPINGRLEKVRKVLDLSKNESMVRLIASGLDELESDPRYIKIIAEMEKSK